MCGVGERYERQSFQMPVGVPHLNLVIPSVVVGQHLLFLFFILKSFTRTSKQFCDIGDTNHCSKISKHKTILYLLHSRGTVTCHKRSCSKKPHIRIRITHHAIQARFNSLIH